MIQVTKLGTGLLAVVLLVGFGLVGYGEYNTTQAVKNQQPVVVTKTVVVTPTVAPTATPAATLKVVKPLTK